MATATEMAMMTATTMTMETKVTTAATVGDVGNISHHGQESVNCKHISPVRAG